MLFACRLAFSTGVALCYNNPHANHPHTWNVARRPRGRPRGTGHKQKAGESGEFQDDEPKRPRGRPRTRKINEGPVVSVEFGRMVGSASIPVVPHLADFVASPLHSWCMG